MTADPPTRQAKGERTLIQTLLERVQFEPDRIYGSYLLTDDVENGFRDFTVGELSQAVDVCAWLIKDQYGLGTNHETLLYMGCSDFRYTIVFFAAIKCGYKACFQSPKNPILANISILEQTGCIKALHSPELDVLIKQYLPHRPQLRTLEVPTLDYFFKSETEPFPFPVKPWADAKHEPILVLHSSGTTGNPKPIMWRNGSLKGMDAPWSDAAGQLRLFDQLDGGFFFSPFPASHLGGFFSMTVLPTLCMYNALVMAPPELSQAQSVSLAIQIMNQKHVKMILATPALLDQVSQSTSGVRTLARLKCVAYGGSPLRQSLGDELSSRGIKLISVYGSTEAGWLPTYPTNAEDWGWFHFHQDLKISWEEAEDRNGTYELCFKDEGLERNELRTTHWTLQTDYWRSKDLFTQHPSKPWLWKFSGRQDDMLMLESAGKVNPIPLEDIVGSHALVSGALMAGENRWPPCMLIEPRHECSDDETFKQRLWPSIEEANRLVRLDSRIPYQNIIIVAPDAFVRNPKGGIVRFKTAKRHMCAINELYTRQ